MKTKADWRQNLEKLKTTRWAIVGECIGNEYPPEGTRVKIREFFAAKHGTVIRIEGYIDDHFFYPSELIAADSDIDEWEGELELL